jgi:hypothetical protein
MSFDKHPRRIAPTPVKQSEKPQSPFDNSVATSPSYETSGEGDKGAVVVGKRDDSKPHSKRNLEEIQANHRGFLPPGYNPVSLNAGEKVKKKNAKQQKLKNGDAKPKKDNYANDKQRRRTMPYSALKKKWITL